MESTQQVAGNVSDFLSKEKILKSFPFSFRGNQEAALNKVAEAINRPDINFVVMQAPTGCHAKGQGILMYDGTIKKVEDIVVGDKLMGPDSGPREVLKLIRGRQEMVRITPTKGQPFVVNVDHILSLRKTREHEQIFKSRNKTGKFRDSGPYSRSDFKGFNPILNISVREYLNKSNNFKHLYKLYKTGIDFSSKTHLIIPPYILGAWLGDGSSNSVSITTMDNEIVNEWTKYAQQQGLFIVKRSKINSLASLYAISGKRLVENTALKVWQKSNLINNKHIPPHYLLAPEYDRLELLAGLLDTDGSLHNGCFDFVQKNENIAKGIVFLARSLGFGVQIKSTKKHSQNGTIGNYFRILICGDTDRIPTRILRKKAGVRKQKKSVLMSGFSTELLPEDDFFGFTVNHDHLYLMDDFTVTHNCGKSPIATALANAADSSFILTSNKILQDQYLRDFSKDINDLRGRSNYLCKSYPGYTCSSSPCRGSPSGRGKCAREKACGYHEALDGAVGSHIASMNFAAGISFFNFTPYFQSRQLLIVDEAHLIADNLTNFVEFTVSSSHLSKMLPVGSGDNSIIPNFQTAKEYLPWLYIVRDLMAKREKEFNQPMKVDIMTGSAIKFDDIENFNRKINNIIAEIEDNDLNLIVDNIYVDYQKTIVDKIAFKPVDVSKYAKNNLFRFGNKVVLMSATIINYKEFIKSLGIPPEESFFIDIPSTFPKENRPIIRNFVGQLNKGNMESSMPLIINSIREILNNHHDQKGIIHTHTYDTAKKLVGALRLEFGERLLFPENSMKQSEILAWHAATKIPTVLISPSMTEGVDLKDDLSRFQVLVKVPYPYLGDKVVQARMKKNPDWIGYKTLLTLIQAYGRSIRSETDHSVTYVLDGAFDGLVSRYRKSLPSWFTDAIL